MSNKLDKKQEKAIVWVVIVVMTIVVLIPLGALLTVFLRWAL